jgi:hypothetical protein
MAKYSSNIIQRKDLKGLKVAPSVGGNIFGAITGEELLLGLTSDAITKMTVHALCSIVRIARKEGVFGYLKSKMALLLGNGAVAKEKKGMIDTILKHSPSMNKKSLVSRLVFLARLSAVYRMEGDYLTKEGKTKVTNYIRFEEDTKDAFVTSLNILTEECRELEEDDTSKKRKREETMITDDTIVDDLVPLTKK